MHRAASLLIVALLLVSHASAITKVGVSIEPVDKKGAVDYGVVIDLGSKGSRVSVFIWPADSSTPYHY